MSKSKQFLAILFALILALGMVGTPAYAEEGHGEAATPEPVNKWWDLPRVKSPEEEQQQNNRGFLSRWMPQVFAPPEPGAPPGNVFVRSWRWFMGLFRKATPPNLPPGWKRPLADPIEIEITPVPSPPVPMGTAAFDPLSGTLTVTGVSITRTKPQPAIPASHERAAKAAREFIVSEVASWPTNRGVALSELMSSEDVDALRGKMEEIFAGKQPGGVWVATVRLNVRQFPFVTRNCPGLFTSSNAWTRVLTKPIY